MLPGAVSADPIGVLAAFGAGILSFVSPCVLPLVPGYVSMVSGLSAAELGAAPGRPEPAPSEGGSSERHPDAPLATAGRLSVPVAVGAAAGGSATPAAGLSSPALRRVAGEGVGTPDPVSGGPLGGDATRRPVRRGVSPRLLGGIGLFIAGFTAVFVCLGAAASGVGQLLESDKTALTTASGIVVVVLGAVLLVSAVPAGWWLRLGAGVSGRVAWLVGERRVHVRPGALGIWAAPVMGMAFAFAWTPCIGPVLGAVLGLAAVRSTLAGGVVLLFAYSMGLGVPFVLAGLASDRFTALYARARRRLWVLQLMAAAVLLAFGALLVAGQLGWLSSQFSWLLDHLGLQRLTTS